MKKRKKRQDSKLRPRRSGRRWKLKLRLKEWLLKRRRESG
jgi:hypothetical protein